MAEYYDPGEFRYSAGAGNASSYMVPGRPFVSGGTVPSSSLTVDGTVVRFPAVVKSITVWNRDAVTDLIVYFVSRSDVSVMNNHHYITVPAAAGTTDYFFAPSVRCREVYLSVAPNAASGSGSAYEIYAEMTNISPDNIVITGSGVCG